MISVYLNAVLKDGDNSDLIIAMDKFNWYEEIGLSRPSLNKAFSEG